jgi:hypothetical protein
MHAKVITVGEATGGLKNRNLEVVVLAALTGGQSCAQAVWGVPCIDAALSVLNEPTRGALASYCCGGDAIVVPKWPAVCCLSVSNEGRGGGDLPSRWRASSVTNRY